MIISIYLVPLINTFRYSFMNTMGGMNNFIGFANFAKVQDYLLPIIRNSLVWTFGSIVPSLILGLAAAMVMQGKFKCKRICVMLCLLPYTMPLIIVATSWYFLYHPSFGLLNVVYLTITNALEPLAFLSYENAMFSVILARIWRAAPFAFVVYYAAIQNIPQEILESASVDGCTKYQKFIYIIFPQLKPATLTSGIILTVSTFMVFDIIYTLTRGGPVDATTILPIKIYAEIFNFYDLGAASVLSLISMFILTVITLVYWRVLGGGEALVDGK